MLNTGPGSPAGSPTGDAPPPFDPLDSPTGTPSASDYYAADEPSPTAVPLKLGKDELRELARGAVLALTVVIHQALARTAVEREHGLWLMRDEDEAAGVADPLASIARRRTGAISGEPDAIDLMKAGAAAAGYLAKNASEAFRLRLAVRRARRAGMTPEPEEAPE